MKKLKKEAEKAHRKILEEDSFLEDVLLPLVERNETERREKRKRKKITAVTAAGLSSIAAIVIVIVAVCMFYKPDTLYVGNTETTASDITTINQSLVNTQIAGEFDLITVAYNSKTLIHHYFTVSKEIITEEMLVDLRMVVLVDREFNYEAEETGYTDTFEFLCYTVEYMEKVKETLYEDIPVNEFTVKAFFDTGQECFYITYSEISCDSNSSFAKIVKELIIKK